MTLTLQDICGAIRDRRDREIHNSTDVKFYQLRNVTSFTIGCEDTFISCPYASEVALLNGLSDASIPLLNTLSNIQILRLNNFHETILTFDNGLLPYLRESGTGLIELELSEIGPVDFLDIARTCPNLQRLSYIYTGTFDTSHSSGVHYSEKTTLFSNMTDLKVVLPVMEDNFPSVALECIFCNARKLKKVELINVRNSNKDLLKSSLSQNPLECLSELRLENCNWLTGDAIKTLLQTENDLYSVSTLKCDHVRLRDHEKFVKYVKKHEISIHLEWS